MLDSVDLVAQGRVPAISGPLATSVKNRTGYSPAVKLLSVETLFGLRVTGIFEVHAYIVNELSNFPPLPCV